jgi:preprotein translocase subunit SecB
MELPLLPKMFNYWPESLQTMRAMDLSANGTMTNQFNVSMTIRVDKDKNNRIHHYYECGVGKFHRGKNIRSLG